MLVHRHDEDHQLVVEAQVTEDVTLRHRHVQAQDLQDVVDRHRLVLVQLHTEGRLSGKNHGWSSETDNREGGSRVPKAEDGTEVSWS